MSDKREVIREASTGDCRMVALQRHQNPAGTIAVAQNDDMLPFAIRRVFYIYDIPSDTSRGGHCHTSCEEMIVAVSGSFDVTVTDGRDTRTFTLNRPYNALYIPAGVWLSLNNFTSGCVCLTLCSEQYDETNYIRDYDEYLRLANGKQ